MINKFVIFVEIQIYMKIIGIYKIISPNGRIYIGQSINIYERWVHHKIRNDERHTKLNRSFNKYGVDNHTFEIIEECEFEQLNIRKVGIKF